MAGSEKGDNKDTDNKVTDSSTQSSSSNLNCDNSAPSGSSPLCETAPADAAGTLSMEIDSVSNTDEKSSVSPSDSIDPSSIKSNDNDALEAVITSKTSGEGKSQGKARARSPEHNVTVEDVDFKVIFSKSKFDVTFPLDDTVAQLKDHLEILTGVPRPMQKLMIKGMAKDSLTLREAGITKGAKVMLVGSKLDDVLAVSTPSKEDLEEKSSTTVKEPFSKQKMHRKVLDKGVPDDVMPGILNTKEALPPYPLSGMLNKYGGKVRLTFKLELDQVWIGTKERTQKLAMNSIRGVVSEPIEGHEEYHILAIQLGPTEASRYWVYWVPVQYIDAIKDTIMGSWIM